MADLIYRQELTTSVPKSVADGSPSTNAWNMQREPTEVADISEDGFLRFKLAALGTETLTMGTVQAGKIFAIRTDRELKLTITTPYGVSVFHQRKNATSVFHMEYSLIVAENLEGTVAKGYYYCAGD